MALYLGAGDGDRKGRAAVRNGSDAAGLVLLPLWEKVGRT
jgi:hypothetical protein